MIIFKRKIERKKLLIKGKEEYEVTPEARINQDTGETLSRKFRNLKMSIKMLLCSQQSAGVLMQIPKQDIFSTGGSSTFELIYCYSILVILIEIKMGPSKKRFQRSHFSFGFP